MSALTNPAPRRETVRASYDDGLDQWEIREAASDRRLAPFVDCYADYAETTDSFSGRRELAATSGVFIYVLGDPLEITAADGKPLTIKAGEAFVGGAADATSISKNLGPQRGMHIHAPLSTYAQVIGAPPAAIANHCFKLGDMIGAVADDLGGRLCEARTSEDRYRLLDRFFVKRLGATEEGGERCPVNWVARQLRARMRRDRECSPPISAGAASI